MRWSRQPAPAAPCESRIPLPKQLLARRRRSCCRRPLAPRRPRARRSRRLALWSCRLLLVLARCAISSRARCMRAVAPGLSGCGKRRRRALAASNPSTRWRRRSWPGRRPRPPSCRRRTQPSTKRRHPTRSRERRQTQASHSACRCRPVAALLPHLTWGRRRPLLRSPSRRHKGRLRSDVGLRPPRSPRLLAPPLPRGLSPSRRLPLRNCAARDEQSRARPPPLSPLRATSLGLNHLHRPVAAAAGRASWMTR